VSRRGREDTGPSTPATIALERAGIAFTRRTYTHDPAAASYGMEAAKALDLPPARVLKTLLVTVPSGLAVAIVPVDGTLDLKAMAAALAAKSATMADPVAAERATGYVLGGISPIGQRRALPTVLDESATAHPTVFVSGGRRGFDIELAPTDLIRITGAVTAAIGRH
jgi:Cys-tRNA(Pro)/Cys-tRNA(Cys) deacylase